MAGIEMGGAAGQDFWAVTAYFNPLRYRRRALNYRVFHEHLGVPLLTVELGYRDQFELGPGDADVLVQIPGRDVMWQKECLLNIALKVLPSACRSVAWVDCDVIFCRPDWAEQAARRLERTAIVQLFAGVQYAPAGWLPSAGSLTPLAAHRSLVSAIRPGFPIQSCLAQGLHRSLPGALCPGHAWAARRDAIEPHGLYAACIVGGGDTALAGAAYGAFDAVSRFHVLNTRQRDFYLAWAEPFHRTIRADVRHLAGDILHLWHGDFANRQGESRHIRLSGAPFDPFTDIAPDENGCWRWASAKPHLHEYVRSYFTRRREDG